MTDEFETLVATHRVEIDKIKGSRFVGTAAPIAAATDIERLVQEVRDELGNASHHVWAYRLGTGGTTFRFSDDGEPSGSAGRPILKQIEGHGLTDTAVIVTRWFGGTKLGVGGLMRAYGGAASAVLQAAPRQRLVISTEVEIEFDYGCSGAVQGLLAAHRLAPVAADYGARVRMTLRVAARDLDRFAADFADCTAARGRLRPT